MIRLFAVLAISAVVALVYLASPTAELEYRLRCGAPGVTCWSSTVGETEARELGRRFGYEAARVTGPDGEPGWHFVRRP